VFNLFLDCGANFEEKGWVQIEGKWKHLTPCELALIYQLKNPQDSFWMEIVKKLSNLQLRKEMEETKKMKLNGKNIKTIFHGTKFPLFYFMMLILGFCVSYRDLQY